MEALEGSRSGSLVYLYQGFLYLRYKTWKDVVYLRCREIQCPVVASMNQISEKVVINGEHSHSAPVEDVEELRLRSGLRKAIQQDKKKSVRTIFEEVAKRFEFC